MGEEDSIGRQGAAVHPFIPFPSTSVCSMRSNGFDVWRAGLGAGDSRGANMSVLYTPVEFAVCGGNTY